MLRTNLSTRPFYNERAVHWGLAAALVAILALTAFNVTRVLALSQQQSVLAGAAERDEAQARALVADAASLRASIDQKALEHVVHAAEEANDIIDQRTLSWTELLNHIERTLPPGVMLTSVSPRLDKGKFYVQLVVHGKSVETVDDFIEKLEGTHAFSGMSPVTEQILKDGGLYEVTITGEYHPGVAMAEDKKSPEQTDADNTDADNTKPAASASAATPAAAGKPTATAPSTSTRTSPVAPTPREASATSVPKDAPKTGSRADAATPRDASATPAPKTGSRATAPAAAAASAPTRAGKRGPS